MDSNISSPMAQVQFFYSLALTSIFKVKVLAWEVEYLPSNGATANVVRHDRDLYFQGHEFLNVNISKTVRASE